MFHIRGMRRNDICLYLGPADRAELQALITNRNTARNVAEFRCAELGQMMGRFIPCDCDRPYEGCYRCAVELVLLKLGWDPYCQCLGEKPFAKKNVVQFDRIGRSPSR